MDKSSAGGKCDWFSIIRFTFAILFAAYSSSAAAEPPPTLFAPPARAIDHDTRYVSATVFHWFTSTAGQRSGPWRPVEGRETWTGEPAFWQDQIKQMMSADIDVLYVHLIRSMEDQRVNLFRALGQLRSQGYDVPKVAPFLDPLIIWDSKPPLDLATPAGKDEIVADYIRFFQQYYSANTDPLADDYLAKFDGKLQIDTWHLHLSTVHREAITKADIENRLTAAFGKEHPVFKNGIHMVTTAHSPTFSFTDEKLTQFEVNENLVVSKTGDYESAQIKAGYWDQNARNPGSIMPRDGGVHYPPAWKKAIANSSLRHVNIESWNEYDEGTGIYRASPGPPYLHPGMGNHATDKWSETDDPLEYIKATAVGASEFNSVPQRDAHILWHNLPKRMKPGEAADFQVVVRNDGDLSWTEAKQVRFGQQDFVAGETLFGTGRFKLDDTANEIPTYGGIFRGRPVTFAVHLVAPTKPGTYTTHWSMLQENAAWFGEVLTVPIEVRTATDQISQ